MEYANELADLLGYTLYMPIYARIPIIEVRVETVTKAGIYRRTIATLRTEHELVKWLEQKVNEL